MHLQDISVNIKVNEDLKQHERKESVLSEASFKQRKGDKTPNSNRSKIRGHSSVPKSNKSTPKHCDANEISEINPIQNNNNRNNHESSTLEKTKNLMNQTGHERNYSLYDTQQLSYDLVKEYSHMKIDKDESFMKRMLFDVFKRQTKEERIEKLIDGRKVKMDEQERVKTFNRLIEDANRRIEAQEKLEKLNGRNESDFSFNKKYKTEEWDDIYDERFIKFKIEKERKNEELKTKDN